MSSPPFVKSGSRAQMRRVSLPSALPHPGAAGRHSRSPNSLSPKLGFLKEISEFDIDPPFISPAASSSSSADNSPMLLSPSFQRPASARLYRRNPHAHRGSQPGSPSSRKASARTRAQQIGGDDSPMRRAPLAGDAEAEDTETETEEEEAEEEEDGFRWTDVDGFYGRKDSIPLQQLLANDLALLNGANLMNDEKRRPHEEGDWKKDEKLGKEQNGAVAEPANGRMNIPSDIAEDEDEDEEEDGEENPGKKHKKMDARRSLGVVTTEKQLSSAIKRKMFLASKMCSLEGKQQQGAEDEQDETEAGTKNGGELARNQIGKVKSGADSSVDGYIDATNNDDGNVADEVRELRDALRAKRRQARQQQRAQAQQMRHFSIDVYGQRIVDSGVRTVRAQSDNKSVPQPRNANARRATCPEIWLSVTEDAPLPKVHCALRLYGLINCGKKSVAKQLASSLEVGSTPDDDSYGDGLSMESEDLQRPFRPVSFLLNEQQVHLEIIQGSLARPPESRKGVVAGAELTIFAVVYSVDNRESFIRAAQILYRLYGEREGTKNGGGRGKKKLDRASVPLILIANKIDLQRKRRVTSIEGKMLAKIYKCPFVELSALLTANIDTLWQEVLRKLHKYLQTRERMLQQRESSSGGGDSAGSSPRARLPQRTHPHAALVGRFLERTRRFAKSCGHLIRDQFPRD